MTSRNRPGQNSLLANCMSQRQREKRESETEESDGEDGGRQQENVREMKVVE